MAGSAKELQRALESARLYGIIDLGYTQPERLEVVAGDLLADGQGVQVLQLRAKDHPPEQIARWATALLPLARACGVPFLINDHLEVAVETAADGVHLGQDDGPLAIARDRLGTGKLIGRSTHSLGQAETAAAEGADYIGFGPLNPTPTKPGRPAIGLDWIPEVHRLVELPVFCIGGIKPDHLPGLRRAGVRRAVIVSGLLQARDIRAASMRARRLLADEAE